MSKRNRIIICMTLCILVLLCVVYFNINNDKTIRIGVFTGSPWGVPDAYTYEFIDDAIEKFEKEHPGVTVEYISGIMKEDYSEWLSGQVVAGKAPDVFMVLPDDFSVLTDTGAIMCLDSIISKDKTFDSEKFYEGSYKYGNVSGKQYALPLESAPEMMFVNKSLLAKETILVPETDWTWDDFYNICEKVTKDSDGNGVIDQFGVYNYSWEQAFLTNGVHIFDDSGKNCTIQGENAQQAVDFLKKINALNKGTVVTSLDFDMGRVVFMPVTLAEYRTYKPYPWSIKKYSKFNWECITLPRGPQGENVSTMNTLILAMNSRTKKKEIAWELMKTFCYDSDIQLEVYKYRGGGSVLKEVLNQNQALLNENQALPKNSSLNIRIIQSIMEAGVPAYNFSNFDDSRKLISNGITEIIDNNENPPIALKNLQREVNQSLTK